MPSQALALVESPEHVCARYRIQAFAPWLQDAGWGLTVEGLAKGQGARYRQLADAHRFDAVIVQRKLLSAFEFRILRQAAHWLVFDFDDAVFWRDSYQKRGHQSRKRWFRFRRTVNQADRVLAGNDFLAARAILAGAGPETVWRLPTCVEPDRYRPKPNNQADSEPVRLVWIGSSRTLRGLEQPRALWDRMAQELPVPVQFRIICDRFPDLGAMPVEPIRWSGATEAEALAEADIGIAWVPDDLWSLGKCGLKVLQYQAAGLPVVANPVGVHNEMIEPGHSGFLARSPDDWITAIGRLAAEADLRRSMGRAARQAIEADYAVAVWAERFLAALSGLRAPRLGLKPMSCRPSPWVSGGHAHARRGHGPQTPTWPRKRGHATQDPGNGPGEQAIRTTLE